MADDRVTVEIETEGSEAVETFDDLAEASKGADKSIDKVNKQIKGLSKSKAIITSVKSSVLSFGKGALAVAGSVGAIGLAAIGAVKAIGAMTDSVRSFKEADRIFQLKGGAEGVEVLKRIQDYGHAAGIGLAKTSEIANKLGQSFDPSSAEYLMQIIGDSRARGGDIEKMGDAFAELGSKTKIAQGDLEGWFNATGMAAPTIEQIAKASGRTFDEVKADLDKGELATNDFIKGVDQANKEMLKTQKTGEGGLQFGVTDAASNLTRIGDSFDNLKMRLMQKASEGGLGKMLSSLADKVDKFVSDGTLDSMINAISGAFKFLGEALAPVIDAFSPLIDYMKQAWAAMSQLSEGTKSGAMYASYLKAVFSVVAVSIKILVVALVEVTKFVWKLIDAFLSFGADLGLIEFFDKLAKDPVAAFSSFVNSIIQWTVDLYNGIVNTIVNLPGTILNFFTNLATGAISIIASLGSTIITSISSMVNGMINMISSSVGSFGASATNIVNSITNPIAQLPAKALELGKQIIDGLYNGITSGIERIKSAISSVTDSIKGVFTSDLQIHSPSKLTTNYGKFVDEGTAIGMTENVDKVEKAASTVTDTIASSFDSGAASPQIGSTGSSTINNTSVPIGINVSIATAGSAAPNIDTNTLSSLMKQLLVGYIESSAT